MSLTASKSPFHIRLVNESGDPKRFDHLVEKWQLVDQADAVLALVFTSERVELRKLDEPKLGPVYVDFVQGTLAHRRQFGGGRGEAVAKAVGIKGDYLPDVIDATAGLGRDAFVLAAIGCKVRLLERHPVVACLLEDGLNRAYQDVHVGDWMQERMQLIMPFLSTDKKDSLIMNSADRLLTLEDADVIYLDPMYPHPEGKKNSALIKKEMRVFQHLVGTDEDADSLLEPALKKARKRVVVKRPDYAPPLNGQVAHAAIKTKSHRFDIYPTI